jgi:EAL domain-containing protein (putative c-di-GMP-specific phosphodiesterase class I)
VLAEEGAQSGSLDIELTESAFIHFSDDLVTMLERVRALGIAIALDDFGMGYSSLTYVRRLPLRAIKVDQTFVRGAVANAGDAAIVRWVARLGLELGLEVIAEGIETDRELELVLEAGCTRGQGYFFGRPVPAETFIELLKSNGTSTPRRARRLRLPTSRNG